MSLLRIANLSVRYGAVQAVREASLTLEAGELAVLIGSNGAGKTSLLRAISRLIPSVGELHFDGIDRTSQPADRLVRDGLCHVPEGRHIFSRMTVQENLQIATWGSGRDLEAELPRIFELFPVLSDRARQTAATLSGGEQQMLAIARALVRQPKLLMLDEPSMGLAPKLVRQVFDLISAINIKGTSVLLVEQNARMALSIAHRAYVMETGRVTGGGPAADLLDDEQLRAAYLGGEGKSLVELPAAEDQE